MSKQIRTSSDKTKLPGKQLTRLEMKSFVEKES